MDTCIHHVGQLPDGRLIGQDPNGSLFFGTKRYATYDEFDVVGTETSVEVRYKGELIAQGHAENGMQPLNGKMEKQYLQVWVRNPDGSLTQESMETGKEVIDWVPVP